MATTEGQNDVVYNVGCRESSALAIASQLSYHVKLEAQASLDPYALSLTKLDTLTA